MADYQITTATGTIHMSGVHDDTECAGRPCIIHSPLAPTNTRNLRFRRDKGIFEEYCEHGVGHPTPEDRRFLQETNQEWLGVHGCDGCCAFIKATRELHARLKDRDTWAEFYNEDRDIEVFLDALNKGYEVAQMSIGSGTTYILDNGLYLVEVMEEDK